MKSVFLAIITAGIATIYGCGKPTLVKAPQIEEQLAYELTAAAAAMTPRHSGTIGAKKQAEFIAAKAREFGAKVTMDIFDDITPNGTIQFCNILAQINGKSNKFILVGCHYDGKFRLSDPSFAAANDGASGVGTLLAMIKSISKSSVKPYYSIRFIFFDGEECLYQYDDNDGLHGSRHYADKLKTTGELAQCQGMILLDMIGDRNLNVMIPEESDPELAELCRKSAARYGYEKYFTAAPTSMLDDHTPFRKAGLPVIDLIDFDYGPNNSYWHTADDQMDKISSASLRIVGDTALQMIYNFK